MESVAAHPEYALDLITRALALIGQAEEAIRALPGNPAAARNLYAALMDVRAPLEAALTVTGDVIMPAYQAGRADERAEAAASRRGGLRAV